MFRFTDADVFWTVYTLATGKKIGRKKLADQVGVGEGSMRRILETLRTEEYITIHQTGISISQKGIEFLDTIPISVIGIQLPNSVVGMYQQAVLVKGVANKIYNGMEQRDAGIKVGAAGCTTVVMRDGFVTIPPDWIVDNEDPELAIQIRETGMTENDVIIVGSASDPSAASSAAVMAALDLI